jgi:hypothetical protein
VVSPPDLNSAIARRLIGAWRYAGTKIDGEFRTDRGGTPAGIIIYDPSGYVAVQIVPAREQRAASSMSQFLAYFGTYSIDEAAGTVTHHRQGDLRSDAPVDAVRQYRFEGDRLILHPVGTTQEVLWDRIK